MQGALILDRPGGATVVSRWFQPSNSPTAAPPNDDVRREFSRTENVRPIPIDDPEFARLYRRRNGAESINRGLDDSLWLGRAHSVGHQRLNLIGFPLMTTSLARARHRTRAPAAA